MSVSRKPSRERGFVEGMELSFGEARSGIGGGICQLSNLIHWMAMHSPLVVIERANHSFDPFPDEGGCCPLVPVRRYFITTLT
ncbi:VanW family protein [Budvicia aquatica]|uniref:VanW family protein n=1 Tax=Budvicia aquatica TaxID=82979 RepID=UPI0034CF5FE3